MEVLGRMPFMIVETDSIHPMYVALARIVRGDDATALVQLRAWALQQVQADRMFQARMLLFVAVYHECFLKGHACESVVRFAGRPECLALLRITVDESRAYLCIARGPSLECRTADDGISYLFSAASFEARDEWISSRRNCAANTMALLLGTPKERCYYYTVCFNDEFMDTYGLGSGHAGLSKDCGYQVELDSFRDFGYGPLPGPPFRNIRRFRAMNNYLVWVSFAWGRLPTAHTSSDYEQTLA